jgi:hypothetical protein
MPKNYNHPMWEHPSVCIGCCAAHFWLGLMIQGITSEAVLIEEDTRVVWGFIPNDGTENH